MGPLHNISFEVGMDANTENNFLAPAKRDVVAGLQFAFDLPYKGYINVAPLMYWEFSNHNAFTQCGLFGAGVAGVTCNSDGNVSYNPTWAVEINYYMDLGFLPPNMQFWSHQRPRRLVRAEGRLERSSCALGHWHLQHQVQDRVEQRTDPSDLRCLEGCLG